MHVCGFVPELQLPPTIQRHEAWISPTVGVNVRVQFNGLPGIDSNPPIVVWMNLSFNALLQRSRSIICFCFYSFCFCFYSFNLIELLTCDFLLPQTSFSEYLYLNKQIFTLRVTCNEDSTSLINNTFVALLFGSGFS